MSAEKIIEQIKIDSEKEIKEILKNAENQSKEIISIAKKDAEKKVEEILENGKKQSENLKKILISKANQNTKREIMNARETMIEECFTKAHHELSILKGKSYENLVKKLIIDGQKKLGGNCVVYVTRDEDKKIAKDLGIDIAGSIESAGGIILKSSDGLVTLDHTFDGILKREKGKLRIKVGKLLFS